MLNNGRFEANIPAADIARAKSFYEEKLGLTPAMEPAPGYLRYETAGGTAFNVYETQYAGMSGHTIAQIHVDDIESQVRDLKAKGVAFEVYDMPGVEWNGQVATLPGMGKAAWFKDSEGNIMCIDEGVPRS